MTNKKKLTVYLEKPLAIKLKEFCAINGTTVSALMEVLVKKAMEENS